jgi:hypothetical protein
MRIFGGEERLSMLILGLNDAVFGTVNRNAAAARLDLGGQAPWC